MNAQINQNMMSLLSLAHDRSEAGRRQLAESLADLFWQGSTQLTAQEEELLNEIVTGIIRHGTSSIRETLAERLARASKVPRRLLMTLAQDHIDVARPVLMYAEGLGDRDLITVISSQSHDHACAIAQRRAVSEAVADALVVTGDPKVMELVATNLGAKLSEKALTIITESARFTATLRDPVMKRPELGREQAEKIYWWLSAEARRATLKRFNIQAGQIDQAFEQNVEAMLLRHELDKQNDQALSEVGGWLYERVTNVPKVFVQVLRLGHYRLFKLALAHYTKLSNPIIDRVVEEPGGRSLAVLARALGADKTSFVSIFLLSRGARPGEQVVHPRELSHALTAFDRVSAPVAQQLLEGWQVNPAYLLQEHAST